MDDESVHLAARVVRARGDGVTLKVLDLGRNGKVVAERAAGSWAQVDFWVHQLQVPWDRVSATDAAAEFLGPR